MTVPVMLIVGLGVGVGIGVVVGVGGGLGVGVGVGVRVGVGSAIVYVNLQRPEEPFAPLALELAPPPPPPPGILPVVPALTFPPPLGAPAPAFVVVLFPAILVS